MTATPELAPVREALSKHPGVILESLARQHGVSYQAALTCLPDDMQTQLPGSCFGDAMADMTEWGDLVVIVHTEDLVMEVKGPLPPGRFGSGFYNLEAETGLSGHIRAERCGAVAFVRRPFMGKDSVSVQFLNREGGCMFKVFVGRDAEGRLKAGQIQRWEELRTRLAAAASA